MKLKVIFLKKKYIYYSIITIAIIVLFLVLIFSKKSVTTFNTVAENKTIKSDLTGDGKEDILYINTNLDKYFLQVNSEGKSFYLKPSTKMPTLGKYYKFLPMKITLMDINRNKIPEIFVQASEDGVSIMHIFLWDKNSFKDIYCSNNNLLGFIDCKNNKTPKIVSGNIANGQISLSNYILINGDLHSFNFNNSNNSFLGSDTILSFINYIQGLPNNETYKPLNIFFPGLTGKDLSIIGKMSGDNNTYLFRDGTFMDTRWDRNGDISEIKWILNFSATSNNKKNIIKKYSLSLQLKNSSNSDKNKNYYYKIKTITKE